MGAIEKGLCQCGCGERTAIAGQTRGDRGQRKGEPVDFVNGAHGRRAAAIPVADRFWPKVAKVDGDGCWLWTGATTKDGYGFLKVGNRNIRAHRLSMELSHIDVPAGLDVLHRCDTPACVRPDHLFLGTHLDNMQDMYSKGRRKAAAGVRNGRAKLTESQVREIRKAPESLGALSRTYGVSTTTVAHIRAGRLWRSTEGML